MIPQLRAKSNTFLQNRKNISVGRWLHAVERGRRWRILGVHRFSVAPFYRLCYNNLRRQVVTQYARLAQLVEHLLDVQEVTGSSPVPRTLRIPTDFRWGFFF